MHSVQPQNGQTPDPFVPGPRWWQRREWSEFLRATLHYIGRQRYALNVSEDNPLGATSLDDRRSWINPRWYQPGEVPITPIRPDQLALVRHAPATVEQFEQSWAYVVVKHEGLHIRHPGTKPRQNLLGWLWNALCDEHIERREAARDPQALADFEFLGDTLHLNLPPEDDLVYGVLYWRFEWDLPPERRRFRPSTSERAWFWDVHIRPRVEWCWNDAPTPDAITPVAREILHLLHRPPHVRQLPRALPDSCSCSGESSGASPDPGIPEEPPEAPDGASLPGRDPVSHEPGKGSGHDPADPEQADPSALLARVEGYARRLEPALKVPEFPSIARPTMRGDELSLDRRMAGSPVIMIGRTPKAPVPRRALGVLVDVSGSMGSQDSPGSMMAGAAELTMMLERAAELAQIQRLIYAYDGQDQPIVIRNLGSRPDPVAQRRIAGMDGGGGTLFWPTYQAAMLALSRSGANQRGIIVLTDACLATEDATQVRAILARCQKANIPTLALYLGSDDDVVRRLEALFVSVIAGDSLESLVGPVSAWLLSMFR